jgi:hypothetical protein
MHGPTSTARSNTLLGSSFVVQAHDTQARSSSGANSEHNETVQGACNQQLSQWPAAVALHSHRQVLHVALGRCSDGHSLTWSMAAWHSS